MCKSTRANNLPIFKDHETEACHRGFRFVFGVDEAGRGPLAGPVVAAAVCLVGEPLAVHVDDSKKLTPAQREKAFHEILGHAHVGIGVVSETAIDEINILNASFHAMENAVIRLWSRLPADVCAAPGFNRSVLMLIDGNAFRGQLPFAHQTIIGGDRECRSIACASIVAKVYRDRMMGAYDRVFPQYGFGAHKGYPTLSHRRAIAQHGPSRIHRKSFGLRKNITKGTSLQ